MSLRPTEVERTAFIKGLKVGDTVGIYRNNPNDERWTKATVKRITPKGAFRVKAMSHNSIENFDEDGWRRCGGSWGWTEILVPWSPEVVAHLAHERLVGSVLFYLDRSVVDREVVEKMTDDELKRLVMALRPLRKKEA